MLIGSRHLGGVSKTYLRAKPLRKLVKFMMKRQANLKEGTYFRVMRMLQESPGLTQREVVETLDISVGGMNCCQEALMERGFVKVKNFANSTNKFGLGDVLPLIGVAQNSVIAHKFR